MTRHLPFLALIMANHAFALSPGITGIAAAVFPVIFFMDFPVFKGGPSFTVILPKMAAKEKCWGRRIFSLR